MPGRGTPQRNVRIGDGLWERFGQACREVGLERTEAIRQFVLWFAGYTDELPMRPEPRREGDRHT